MKGTVGVINIYGVHMNDQVWENPELFNPRRFLDSENNIINAHKLLPFGIGELMSYKSYNYNNFT